MAAGRTLLAYQTKGGATEEAARKIADVLRSKYRLEVDLADLNEEKVRCLAQYAHVIGGGVRGGIVYSKAVKFLENDLNSKTAAFLVSSILGRHHQPLRIIKVSRQNSLKTSWRNFQRLIL